MGATNAKEAIENFEYMCAKVFETGKRHLHLLNTGIFSFMVCKPVFFLCLNIALFVAVFQSVVGFMQGLFESNAEISKSWPSPVWPNDDEYFFTIDYLSFLERKLVD